MHMLNNQHGHSAGQKEGSMKSRTMTCITAMTLLAALAIAVRLRLAAQEAPAAQGQATAHTRYKLIDIGTFGGPSSFIAPSSSGGPENPARALLTRGLVVGAAETAIPDAFSPNCLNPECLALHAFR